ncbi:hypothetical protein ACIBKY_33305 [Nonomuraea sp. NPDC050394]|uniref:hypothetical protein n=1 Tax=Nonomuraea sp. NPDC050394 TaxID=3364363 RepID=UPI0037A9F4B1
MSKTTPEAGHAPGSRRWRMVAVIAGVLLVASLVAGLVWFFADPLNLPPAVLESLDQRASVISMFTGMIIGGAGLVVAALALRGQRRAEPVPPTAEQEMPARVSASGERSVAIGGDNSGIITTDANSGIIATGDNARNVQLRAQVSGPGRAYQAGGEQTVHEGDDHRRSYGGDHVEFHHNAFNDKVVGKQVNTPPPSRDGDEQP